jgi:hypothetical protein
VERPQHLLECPAVPAGLPSFEAAFLTELDKVWEDEECPSQVVGEMLLHFGLGLGHFDGLLNEDLAAKLRLIPPITGKTSAATAVMKALWRVVHQGIWLPRCEETIATERIIGIRPADKRQTHAGPTEPRPVQTSLGFGRSQAQDRRIWARCLP